MNKWVNPDCKILAVHPTLHRFDNVFLPEALEFFHNYFRNGANWQFVTPFTRLFRDLSCHSDSEFYQCKQELEQLLLARDVCDLQIRAAKLFFDATTYETTPHADHIDIAAMMQIYLHTPTLQCPGTLFLDPVPYLIPFVENTGYINFNHDQKQHQSNILARGTRASLGLQLAQLR